MNLKLLFILVFIMVFQISSAMSFDLGNFVKQNANTLINKGIENIKKEVEKTSHIKKQRKENNKTSSLINEEKRKSLFPEIPNHCHNFKYKVEDNLTVNNFKSGGYNKVILGVKIVNWTDKHFEFLQTWNEHCLQVSQNKMKKYYDDINSHKDPTQSSSYLSDAKDFEKRSKQINDTQIYMKKNLAKIKQKQNEQIKKNKKRQDIANQQRLLKDQADKDSTKLTKELDTILKERRKKNNTLEELEKIMNQIAHIKDKYKFFIDRSKQLSMTTGDLGTSFWILENNIRDTTNTIKDDIRRLKDNIEKERLEKIAKEKELERKQRCKVISASSGINNTFLDTDLLFFDGTISDFICPAIEGKTFRSFSIKNVLLKGYYTLVIGALELYLELGKYNDKTDIFIRDLNAKKGRKVFKLTGYKNLEDNLEYKIENSERLLYEIFINLEKRADMYR